MVKKETQYDKEFRLHREKEEAEALVKFKRDVADKLGIIAEFEGMLEEQDYDAWWVAEYNYLEDVREYLNSLPIGCTVRITVEVTGPKEDGNIMKGIDV